MGKQAQMQTRRDSRKIGIKGCVHGNLNVCNYNYKRQVKFSVLSFIKRIEFNEKANKYSGTIVNIYINI